MVSYRHPIVVLANGCFDVFHIGHLMHLKAAALMGDQLVVSLTKDEYVNKGANRPMFNETQREAILLELRCVDRVVVVKNSIEALRLVRPDIFVKGKEYENSLSVEDVTYCKKHGVKIAFTDEPVFSSSEIINAGFGRS